LILKDKLSIEKKRPAFKKKVPCHNLLMDLHKCSIRQISSVWHRCPA